MQPISSHNFEILNDHANGIINQHFTPTTPKKVESNGKWNTISSYLPTAKSVGQTAGWAGGITHGTDITNYAIGRVAPVLLPAATPSFGRAAATEIAKLTINPYALPFIQAGLAVFGGWTAQAVVALTGFVYHRVTSSNNPVEPQKALPTLRELLEANLGLNEKGDFVWHTGEVVTQAEINEIVNIANRFELTKRLSESKREEISNIFDQYRIYQNTLDDKGKFINFTVFKNQTPMTEKEMMIVEEATELLKTNNITNSNKKILKAIKILANNCGSDPEAIKEIKEIQSNIIESNRQLEEEWEMIDNNIAQEPENRAENNEKPNDIEQSFNELNVD